MRQTFPGQGHGCLLALGNTQWSWGVAPYAAGALFDLGRWAECDDLMGKALAARRGGHTGANVRPSAARFAARRGQAGGLAGADPGRGLSV